MTQSLCWVNGQQQSRLDVSDRTIHYGDGVFETLLIRKAKPEFLDRHMQRLAAGCERLLFPTVDWELLRDEIVTRAAQCEDAVLKLILSRGPGGRGYRTDPAPEITRILSAHPLPEWPEQPSSRGIRTRVCHTRLAIQPLLAGIKHLNRLEQVLARAEWNDSAIAEGLMLDYDERLIEGTMSNVFIVHDKVLKTPDLSGCGVAGVMRSVVLDRAKRLNIEVGIQALTLADLTAAQEVFVCNSLIGIWPVAGIDDLRTLEIGPITRRMQAVLTSDDESDQGYWYSR